MKRYAIKVLKSEERAGQKQASRDQDRMRLQSGKVSREQLQQENGFFSSLPLRSFHIAAIGGRPVGKQK